MNKELKHLIHQLKAKSFPDSLLNDFKRHGVEAFDSLLDSLAKGEFKEYQAANALQILKNMCMFFSDSYKEKVFEIAIEYCSKDSIILRDAGTLVTVGMVRTHRECPDSYKLNDEKVSSINERLKIAMSRRLNKEREEYVSWFLKEIT
ncbi:MAG: hypothetical protein OQK04_01680 [Kangiellaceae bacterium]|nr:hypothetical protein [Kangiellaceae bacterium]MCW8997413.1 hypothetical protein [Kangiellaceae bacterium]